ncbi:2-dehydro-3-deoxy-6-phosphogalactonate aldolase [Paremcibacter congregatus]|uniref:2-dehydro-3-deoxy-6-phosphogalactonate aldolase n=1 Tax=Paremcibacter congregatus TaxID=2043170 RepID=UPI003A95CB95
MRLITLDGFRKVPIVAILRGLQPVEALNVTEQLVLAGIVAIEVPLNRPNALQSIKLMSGHFGDQIAIGAGTVLTSQDVDHVHAAGGQFIVSPNTDVDVIIRTKEQGMESCPGFQTPSEAFTALKHGADYLKLFPCDDISPATVKAITTVLPEGTTLLCVGGITAENIPQFQKAGAQGFGIGGSLYKPGDRPEQVFAKAKALVTKLSCP